MVNHHESKWSLEQRITELERAIKRDPEFNREVREDELSELKKKLENYE